ncbi:MAG: hypothetical protein Q7T80_04525 [Methanoregula sp.]|nr:hypothetical protein [Methanoregula sp.]
MKRLKLITVLLALLVAAMVIVPMVSAADEPKKTDTMIQVDPITDTEGYVAVDVINIDSSVKDATQYYYLLVLSDEGKQNYLKDLDAAITSPDNKILSSVDEIADITENLNAIWKKYPIRSETVKGDSGYPSYGGTITILKFAPDLKSSRLSKEENSVLEKSQALLKESYKNNQANVVTPKWIGSPSHQQISYWAAYKESFPNPGTVSSTADDPDLWYDNSAEPFKTIMHGINHYYSPLGVGGAPLNTQYYVELAEIEYDGGSYVQAATDLGYASHFLEDVGNPMHTGREWDQYNNQWVHSNYENYIGNHWYPDFETTVSNNYNYFWYTDWALGTRDLAGYSNGYLDTLYTNVYNKGQNWNLAQDSTIDATSQNMILRTAKYTNGLALYARIV